VQRGLVLTATVVFCVWWPSTTLAEVMDKVLSVDEIWSWTLFAGIASLFIGRTARVVVAAVACSVLAAVSALVLLSAYAALADQFIGRDILREAGPGYVAQVHAATFAAAALQIGAIAL
jgi:hypothetical protein